MNNQNQITGTIAVYDDAAINAKFNYAINTSNNKVTYTLACYWKCRNVYGECPFRSYADAQSYFDGLPAVAGLETVDAKERK